jgi:hypothetical protein
MAVIEMAHARKELVRWKTESLLIGYDDVEKNGLYDYVAFASDLRLQPGHRPVSIQTVMGNGLNFQLVEADDNTWVYHQEMGCLVLTIYND